ncbi:TetR/AcrR family transcriptional regulator [Actinoplanes friuliensis]|uniref:TetR family transcriptional regulator n=1 Tax=Actinoplanes friuliensis DSM 7358 TaxID=1246995 RepID=U5W2M4_9ACTN|nr:TetR family transcriptional regulator C-terminal domain-containing protein [Actinoplanes friuliensis]AGZ42156.1 TetR family transcriptional regulator [Actinoplanes friuliensis DSM 7358]
MLVVVARQGLEAASLRSVAEQAGLAIGSVRHYVDGHEELIIFAVGELGRRIRERVWSHAEPILASVAEGGDRAARRRHTVDLLAEWLPLDDMRRDEAALRHTFAAAARTRPELRPHAEAMREEMASLVARVLDAARAAGGLPAELDVELETVRLCALLDGLSVHPERCSPAMMTAVLERHLDSLGGQRVASSRSGSRPAAVRAAATPASKRS